MQLFVTVGGWSVTFQTCLTLWHTSFLNTWRTYKY
jgi:hypothetical protein